jgi:signal transduction histidine kinase
MDGNEIIGELVEMLRTEADRYGVSIHTDFTAEVPAIRSDRVQLQQVLMNLMLNAIEAMKETGGSLSVESRLNEDGLVQISVSDTGPGLPATKEAQIFEPFFTTKPQGSGMGLAICRSIIESQGGHLWADVDRECGASFHFALPTANDVENGSAAGA